MLDQTRIVRSRLMSLCLSGEMVMPLCTSKYAYGLSMAEQTETVNV